MKWVVLAVVSVIGCVGEHRDARDKFNEGAAALAKGEHETAEKLLLEARSAAGVDPELRFRAAYDLGLAYAAHADKVKHAQEADLAKALELAQQAASWFSDAARLRKDDADTQANLAIVRARVQALTDELRKAEGKLEARLDAVIRDQRGVLDDARKSWFSIKQAGGSDPLAQQGALAHLADRERGVVAEAGTLLDLANDEIDAIAKKPDDKRTDEEKVRMIQLKALDIYLVDARTKISDARRKLQELAAEAGVGRAESALVALKRGREQLLDPITVLKGVMADQLELVKDTIYGGGETRVLGTSAGPVPGWLQPAMLAERQGGLHDRVEEVQARLLVAVTEQPPADQAPPPDAKRDKLLARVRAALPSVTEASTAMDKARQALGDGKLKPALEYERAAYEALARAIEQFSDLKQTIEFASQEQQRIVRLLSPEAAKDLPAAERSKETRDAVARNLARVTRLQELIADEVAELAKAPAEPANAGSGSAAPDDAKKQQAEAAKQRLARAEQLRSDALAALAELDKTLAGTPSKKAEPADPMPSAKLAESKLEELRKLFFSIIEHLEQLIRDQGDTRDQTSAIDGQDDIARAPKLPGLVTREDEHGAMAKAITDALAAQADAAGKQPAQPGAPDGKTFAAAAEEVRHASSEIGDARANLVKARDATKTSETLKPALKGQAKAIEHLENALRLLQPPKKQKQDQKQDQDKQKDKDKQQQPPAGAGQRARDNDAAQQKKRHERDSASDPVEKDW